LALLERTDPRPPVKQERGPIQYGSGILPDKEKEMKYLKMLGLAAIAAMGLMAFVGAGTASAKEGVICSTTTTPCSSKWAVGTVAHWSLKTATTAKLTDTNGNTLDTCSDATVKQKLLANPDGTGTATGENTEVIWGTPATPCTVTTDTIKKGKWKVAGIAGTDNGFLISDETTEVTVNVFSSCNYGVEPGTQIGELIGGAAPVFKANAMAKKLAGGFLCPETTKWVAEYVLTEPVNTPLYVRPS